MGYGFWRHESENVPEANIEVRTIKRFTALSLEIAFEVESHLTNLTCPLAPGGRLRPWFLLFTVMFQLLAFVLALLDLDVAESCGSCMGERVAPLFVGIIQVAIATRVSPCGEIWSFHQNAWARRMAHNGKNPKFRKVVQATELEWMNGVGRFPVLCPCYGGSFGSTFIQ